MLGHQIVQNINLPTVQIMPVADGRLVTPLPAPMCPTLQSSGPAQLAGLAIDAACLAMDVTASAVSARMSRFCTMSSSVLPPELAMMDESTPCPSLSAPVGPWTLELFDQWALGPLNFWTRGPLDP